MSYTTPADVKKDFPARVITGTLTGANLITALETLFMTVGLTTGLLELTGGAYTSAWSAAGATIVANIEKTAARTFVIRGLSAVTGAVVAATIADDTTSYVVSLAA